VDIANSQLPRIVRLALIGAATAFAWIVACLVLGLGPGTAHADESDNGGLLGGALGAVTSVVDDSASTVTDAVSTVTTEVASTVISVVAVTPAPVQQPVAHLVQTVGAVAPAVTQPVSDAVSEGVVAPIAQPIVDLVSEVPVVGTIVTGVGLDDAVTDLGATVDDTLAGVVDSVEDAGATIGGPSTGLPGTPGLPALPLLPGSAADTPAAGVAVAATVTGAPDSPGALLSLATTLAFRGLWAAASVFATTDSDAVVASSAAPLAGGISGSAGGLCLPASAAGPGGAGPGAWALAALLPLAAHRAWVRRAGPEDEQAPPAPAGSTDVSPD